MSAMTHTLRHAAHEPSRRWTLLATALFLALSAALWISAWLASSSASLGALKQLRERRIAPAMHQTVPASRLLHVDLLGPTSRS